MSAQVFAIRVDALSDAAQQGTPRRRDWDVSHSALRIGAVFGRVLLRCFLYSTRGVARLPWNVQRVLGGGIGWLLYRLMRQRRGIADTNLACCFPDLDHASRDQIVRHHFRSLGLATVEIAIAWWGSHEVIAARSRVIGSEHLVAALAHGRGVILFGGHFTTFEIGGRILASRYEVGATYRPHSDPSSDTLLRAGRGRYLSTLVSHKNVREMVRYLGENRILWYAPDQDYRGQRRVFARFFAERAATTTATSWLAHRSGARIIPYASHRRTDDSGWDLVLEPALKGFPTGDDLADAERLNAVLEAQIERSIEQYLWVHRRFKTRPPGASPVYDEALLRQGNGVG